MPIPRILSSLTNRIFLAAALLVIVATGVTAVFVNSRVTAQAELELQRGLVESGAVVGRQGEALVETLSALARLIADLPKLKGSRCCSFGSDRKSLVTARTYCRSSRCPC